ncbi:MAG TPA: type IV toxin-antitoxin system AbiEi family antitoxin domain-containing protein [Candidatus Nanopelagicales bacterium]|nr:type IV toxin-antitoxin system AbiEi family antitoxin domain-containing protein [Candidatus Nanopelagicales bacterium]
MSGRRTVFDEVPGLRPLAAAQLGVVRRDQLLALGITHKQVRRHVDAGRWRLIGGSVVVLSTGTLTRRQEMHAAVLHCGPRGALSCWTALEREGLRGWLRPGIHVDVPHGALPSSLPGLVVHQTRRLDEIDIAPGEPRSVVPARAAIDAAGLLPTAKGATGLVLAVAQQRLASPQAMLDVLKRRWRVRHTAVLREVLAEAAEGSDSGSELDVYRIIRRIGFRDVRRQVRIETRRGPVVVDLGVALADGSMLLVEVDGPSHDDPLQRNADSQRDADLIALGYVVIRIPVALLRSDPRAVDDQFRAIWMGQRTGKVPLSHPERGR